MGKVVYESLCPKCGAFDYHEYVESVKGAGSIPPRDVLKCCACGQVFYRKVVNGENQSEAGT